jgi:hypothetical protein
MEADEDRGEVEKEGRREQTGEKEHFPERGELHALPHPNPLPSPPFPLLYAPQVLSLITDASLPPATRMDALSSLHSTLQSSDEWRGVEGGGLLAWVLNLIGDTQLKIALRALQVCIMYTYTSLIRHSRSVSVLMAQGGCG